ncbi:hypothetical protein ACJIZ3_024285 [Penstemon smallii]|uniref:4-coumarate--CoA ligase n=1 Tax=Penstemon smallii TaxID=265156 RepID=A0ABD3TRE6_9LAMI
MSAPPVHGGDGIYRSPRPPLTLPQDPKISMIPFLFTNLSQTGQTPALIDSETGQTITFSQLKTQISNLSNSLLNLNISKNDVVLILSPNSILYPISFLAVVSIGAIATPANTHYTVTELSKQIQNSSPKLIITTHQLHHKVKHFDLPCILLTPKNPSFNENRTWYYSDLVNDSSIKLKSKRPLVTQSDVAALFYSSGTTGTNKGVILTHKNFIASAMAATSDQEFYKEPRNVFLCFLPLFHIYALSGIIYGQLQRGNTVVVMEKYDLDKMLSAVGKYRVSHLYVVPPVVKALAKQPEVVRKYDVSSLKEIGSAAAPLGKEMMVGCAKVFPKAAILQIYGLTETCAVISMENARVGSHHSGSTGVLVPGFQSKIIDVDNLKALPPFHKGEILVRGPMVMQGYFKNKKATEETIDEEGWLHTGDLGYFDDEGRLYIVDRLKELIKCKGFPVAPAELEELLVSHPGITDAAVIPFPDAEAGEVPVAFVVRLSNSSISEDEVQKFVAEQVAPFKRLRKVTFVDCIPKSAAGKILRRELKQKFISKL